MKTVIIINGLPRSGKDTVVERLTEHLGRLEWCCASFSSIDPVRELLMRNGFPIARKTEADRKLMAAVGDALEDYNAFKTRGCVQFVEQALADFVFIHMREPAMIARLTEMLLESLPGVRVVTLFVEGRGERITSNAADANVENYAYDLRVGNYGDLVDLDRVCENLALHLAQVINARAA